MLHKKAAPLAQIIRNMFHLILQVWVTLRAHPVDSPIPAGVHKVSPPLSSPLLLSLPSLPPSCFLSPFLSPIS